MMGGQEPLNSVEEMASYYIASLRSVQPEGPYLLGGWSMGGVVAFEMARQLQSQGQMVAMLALLDSALPDEDFPAEDEATFLYHFAYDLGLFSILPADSSIEFQQLSFDDQLAGVLSRAISADLVPADINFAEFRGLFEIFKSNIQALHNYAPQKYAGRITLFTASEPFDSGEQRPDLEGDVARRAQGAKARWDLWAEQGVDSYVVPGNHYTMVREPNVNTLAARLKARLPITAEN